MRWANLDLPPEARPAWLGSYRVTLPVPDGIAPQVTLRGDSHDFNFDPSELMRILADESFTGPMPAKTRFVPFSYQRLPGRMRFWGAKIVYLRNRWRRRHEHPPWPVAPGLDVLRSLTGRLPTSAWPNSTWALSLTIDVDSHQGLRRAAQMADALDRRGFRGCFYIVAEAIHAEPGLVRELAARGHEIGSHDVVHDNRLAYLPLDVMNQRLAAARRSIEPFAGCGFRSPSLLRSHRLLEAVGQHFAYDSSTCDSDLEFARGCTTVFPFQGHGCLEIPITLPMDSSLTYVGYSPRGMVAAWRDKCGYVRAVGGLAVLTVHSEPHLCGGRRLFAAFDQFLDWIAEQRDVAVLRPAEVLQQSAAWPAETLTIL